MHFWFPIWTFLPEANSPQCLFWVYVQHYCNPVTVICAGRISAKSICSVLSCLLNILKRELVRFFHNIFGSNTVHVVYCTTVSFALCTSYYQIRMKVGHVLIQVRSACHPIQYNGSITTDEIALTFEYISPCCLAIRCTYTSHIKVGFPLFQIQCFNSIYISVTVKRIPLQFCIVLVGV